MLTMKMVETVNYRTQARQTVTYTPDGIPINNMGGGNFEGWLFCRTLPNVTVEKSKDPMAWVQFLEKVAARIKYLTKFTNTFDISVTIKNGRSEIYGAAINRTGDIGLPVKTRIYRNQLTVQ